LERHRIQKEAELYVDNQLQRYLYGVAHSLTELIPDSSGLSGLFRLNRPEIDKQRLEDALTGDGFRTWVEALGPEVDEFIREKWQEAVGQLHVRLQERFSAYYAGEAQHLEGLEGLGGSSGLMEGLKEGLTTGGVIGTGMATYAAVLGPAAASVTMGAALGAFLPPALLIGGAAGMVLRWLRSGEQAERLRIKLRDAIERHRQKLQSDWLRATVFPTLYRHNAAIADTLHRAFVEQLCQGWSPEELQKLTRDVAAHGEDCAAALASLQATITTRPRGLGTRLDGGRPAP